MEAAEEGRAQGDREMDCLAPASFTHTRFLVRCGIGANIEGVPRNSSDRQGLCHFAKFERRLAKYSASLKSYVPMPCDLPPSRLPRFRLSGNEPPDHRRLRSSGMRGQETRAQLAGRTAGRLSR